MDVIYKSNILKKLYLFQKSHNLLTACMRHAAVLHFTFSVFHLPQIRLCDGSKSSRDSSNSYREYSNTSI